MTAFSDLKARAWEAEFDVCDDEAEAFKHRRERMRRIAVHRLSSSVSGAALPSPERSDGPIESGNAVLELPNLTRHARTRLQQRGITIDQVTKVLDYGSVQRAHGASRYFLDKAARQRIAVSMPDELRSLQALDIQVVVSNDGALITAAHRTKRLWRQIQSRGRAAPKH